MEMIQTILLTALLFVRLCISISFLADSIQSLRYGPKREKRKRHHTKRDKEYHDKRIEDLLNK